MSATLGIDTSTSRLAVAVVSGTHIVAETAVPPDASGRPRHARELMVAVEEAVTQGGGWQRISLVGVGIGPGTFTGLRIGIATANALAGAQDLALAGVSSLAALAAKAPPRRGGGVLAVADAKRSEVFAALYGDDGSEAWEPWVGPPGALAERIAGAGISPLAVGEGAVRFWHELEAAGAHVPGPEDPVHALRGASVCELARAAGGGREPVQPTYLRRPDAELWRERDRKPDTTG